MHPHILVCTAVGQVLERSARQLASSPMRLASRGWVCLEMRRVMPGSGKPTSQTPPTCVLRSRALKWLLACSDDPQQDALEVNMVNAYRAHGVRHVTSSNCQPKAQACKHR